MPERGDLKELYTTEDFRLVEGTMQKLIELIIESGSHAGGYHVSLHMLSPELQ